MTTIDTSHTGAPAYRRTGAPALIPQRGPFSCGWMGGTVRDPFGNVRRLKRIGYADTYFSIGGAAIRHHGRITGDAPGAGGDWDDTAPAGSTAEARALADQIIAAEGEEPARDAAAEWINATGCDLDRFGHCVALKSLGYGVGLIDDWPNRVPMPDAVRRAFRGYVEGYGVAESDPTE
jgi:hypothetical protein